MRGMVILGVVVACLLSGERLWGATPEPTGAQQSQGLLAPGQPAPDFVTHDPDGISVALHDYRGRPVILNFWATWCAPCRQEMRALQTVYEAHKAAGLAVLAVSQDQQDMREAVRAYWATLGCHLPTAPGPRGACGHPLQRLLAPEHGVHSPLRDGSCRASGGPDSSTDRAVPAGDSATARVGSSKRSGDRSVTTEERGCMRLYLVHAKLWLLGLLLAVVGLASVQLAAAPAVQPKRATFDLSQCLHH